MQPFDAHALAGPARNGAQRAAVADAIRRCYERSGVPWHDRVVWAPDVYRRLQRRT